MKWVLDVVLQIEGLWVKWVLDVVLQSIMMYDNVWNTVINPMKDCR